MFYSVILFDKIVRLSEFTYFRLSEGPLVWRSDVPLARQFCCTVLILIYSNLDDFNLWTIAISKLIMMADVIFPCTGVQNVLLMDIHKIKHSINWSTRRDYSSHISDITFIPKYTTKKKHNLVISVFFFNVCIVSAFYDRSCKNLFQK